MAKGAISALIAALFAAGAAMLVAGFGGFSQEDAVHWRDFLADHDSVAHSADVVFALVLACIAYWRGMADG